MSDTPPEAPRTPLWKSRPSLITALAAALVYGIGIYFLFDDIFAGNNVDDGLMITLGFLIGAPAGAAAVAVWVADPRGEAPGQHAPIGCLVTLVMLGVGVVLLNEGGICAVMAAPIFLPVGLLSAMITGSLLAMKRGGLKASALPLLPLLILPAEGQVTLPVRTETVTDSIVVAAPPEAVWRQLLEVRDIRPAELGWTFSQNLVGVPKPLDARLEGRGVGAVRHVTWGNGVRFREEITRWDQGRALDWRFRFAADSIPDEVERHVRVDGNHLSLDSGGYRLEPLSGGRTRLTLTTRYRVRTAFNFYCAWWGDVIVGDLHGNVLRVIVGRAEAGAKTAG